jgi:hypothetical protein
VHYGPWQKLQDNKQSMNKCVLLLTLAFDTRALSFIKDFDTNTTKSRFGGRRRSDHAVLRLITVLTVQEKKRSKQ